jgi:hypothetical protein
MEGIDIGGQEKEMNAEEVNEHISWIRARSSILGLICLAVGAGCVGFGAYLMDAHLFITGLMFVVLREVLYAQTLIWRVIDLMVNKKTDMATGMYVSDDD